MLIVSPRELSTIIDVRIDSGIETAMMSVLRQLPRKSRIISAVRHGRDHRLAHHAGDRGLDEDRLVGERLDLAAPAAASARRAAAASRMPLTTSIVEALPAFRMLTSTPRWPSCRTMLVCGAKPSLTVATSRR